MKKEKKRVRGILNRKLENPEFKKVFGRGYDAFSLEVKFLRALEQKEWTYSVLAKALKTAKSNVSRDLKGGGIYSASLRRVERMADALDLAFVPLLVEKKSLKRILPKLKEAIS